MKKLLLFLFFISLLLSGCVERGGCKEEGDCVLAYVGEGPCAPCNQHSEEFQCVSREEAVKIEEERARRVGTQVNCPPCPPERRGKATCSCQQGTCQKILEEAKSYCEKDSDCVAVTCCHPDSCVTRDLAPDCESVSCTQDCRSGTMDCGCGICQCVDNECLVNWNKEEWC